MKAAISETEVVCLSDRQSISNIDSIFGLEKKTEEIHRRLWIVSQPWVQVWRSWTTEDSSSCGRARIRVQASCSLQLNRLTPAHFPVGLAVGKLTGSETDTGRGVDLSHISACPPTGLPAQSEIKGRNAAGLRCGEPELLVDTAQPWILFMRGFWSGQKEVVKKLCPTMAFVSSAWGL